MRFDSIVQGCTGAAKARDDIQGRISVAIGQDARSNRATRKGEIIRGELSPDLQGPLIINGERVYGRIRETIMDTNQCLEFWANEQDLKNQPSKPKGRISLQEPCAMHDGVDDDDNVFIVIDHTKTEWKIECSDRESFFAWFDAVDDQCDAILEDQDLQHDGPLPIDCPFVPKMLR